MSAAEQLAPCEATLTCECACSILATNSNYLSFHLATRDVVRHLMKHRGFRVHHSRRLHSRRWLG